MGTIHTLPTDKPSRLHTDSREFFLTPKYQIGKQINSIVESANTYITNDEKIKEGDWVIYTNGIKIHCKKLDNKEDVELANIENSGVLKIILTTDQDLIKDGVQAIDDEFLEWFVKNSSCEEVEVEWVDFSQTYFIKIQKEEAKQGTMSEAIKQVISNQLKQETLEEVVYKLFSTMPSEISTSTAKSKALELAKWQQEQDKKLYSEEEVKSFLNSIISEIGIRKENIEKNQDKMPIHLLEGGLIAFESSIDVIKKSFEEFKKK